MATLSLTKGKQMKLVITESEIESALLAWGKEQFPRMNFDAVEFDIGYGTLRSATLTHKEPEDAQS